jgi:hypothetical protein
VSFYTAFVDYYEAIFPFSKGVAAFLRRYLPEPPASVLDVGCGTGHYTGHLAQAGYDAVGLDLDAAMIAHARAHYPGAAFHVMNMLDLETLDRAFDGVICIGNTAAHLPQAQVGPFLDGVDRVREAGPWILQVMNWDYVLTQTQVAFPVLTGQGPDGVEVAFYRAYRDISEAQVTFATRLEVAGAVVFEDAVPLYPLRSSTILDLHAERGFELVAHRANYAGDPFDPAQFSANIFVFA